MAGRAELRFIRILMLIDHQVSPDHPLSLEREQVKHKAVNEKRHSVIIHAMQSKVGKDVT